MTKSEDFVLYEATNFSDKFSIKENSCCQFWAIINSSETKWKGLWVNKEVKNSIL